MTRNYLPTGSKVLVVGCGTGTEAVYCAKSFPDVEVTVVDISSGMLQQFERRKNKAIPHATNVKTVSR